MLTELQMITLRDVFRQAGLDERKIEDVFLLLRYKPEKVQQAFYYTAQGMTSRQVSACIGTPRRTVSDSVRRQCSDIHAYLKNAGN